MKLSRNAEADNAYHRRIRAHRRARGLCPTCGSDDLRGRIFCHKCRKNRMKVNRRKEKAYREEGKCYCGRPIPEHAGEKAHCPVCADRQSTWHRLQNVN